MRQSRLEGHCFARRTAVKIVVHIPQDRVQVFRREIRTGSSWSPGFGDSALRAPAPKVIVDPEAPTLQATIISRSKKRPHKRKTGMRVGKSVEGATQKANGKWHASHMFPGREFDDLDEYRAAKKQRFEQRAAYYADNRHAH